ncbi:uncharacterized protein TNCV_450191 [Trichonephila clavipes]|nr:uncharacterized protein TNCV_450191 [Trichonephila clavipes]
MEVHLNDNDILIPQQHGFRAGLSTSHQLLRVVEYIKSGFQDRKSTGAVFLDIQKAFDRNQGRTQNSVASSITSNSNVGNFRLPKLSIPQFNGHFKDWINFKDLFVSTVHSQVSISNVEKFQYLKGLLTNEPASLIKHMPISNDSYEEAWRKLLDIGEQASSKDCWLIYLLLQKIDPESRRLWAIKSSEEEFPNMKALLDFLNVRCSSLELMLNNEFECVKFRLEGNETSQGEGANAGTRNEGSEFKGQAGESQIYSGASVNSELNLSFLPTAKNNVQPHTLLYPSMFHNVKVLPWPARSLYLTPMENEWNIIRRKRQRHPQPELNNCTLIDQEQQACTIPSHKLISCTRATH